MYAFAQSLLDAHLDARDLVDEARWRRAIASTAVGDLGHRSWHDIEMWRRRSRPVSDYAAAIGAGARQLGLGEERAQVVHDLAGRSGYTLTPGVEASPPGGPAPAVASKIAADLTGAPWGSGAIASRQARYRFVGSLEPPTFIF